MKTEGGNPKRLLTLGNNLRVAGGKVCRRRGNWLLGIKEGTSCNGHWVLYATDKSSKFYS